MNSSPLTHSVPASHRRLDTMADSLTAIHDVIGTAVRHIRVFDISLAEYGFNQPERIEQLSHFLRSGRKRRLDIIVHQTDYLERFAPRMINLLRTHADCISISKTTPRGHVAMDAFITADDHSYWHRLHVDHPRAVAAINDIQGCAGLILRFAELTEASEPSLSATTLGL